MQEKTYTVIVDEGNGARKFKIYNQPDHVVRELGIPVTREQGMTVDQAKATLADFKRRIDHLDTQRGRPGGGGDVEFIVERTPGGNITGSRAPDDDTGEDVARIVFDRKNRIVRRE